MAPAIYWKLVIIGKADFPVVSELFSDLYDRAVRREHPRLVTARGLLGQFGPGCDMVGVSRVAAALEEVALDFDDSLRLVAQRTNIRVRQQTLMCLLCGQSHCPDAVPVMQLPTMSTHMLQHLLNGGDPYSYEEPE